MTWFDFILTERKITATRGGRRPNAGRKPVLNVEEQLAFVIRVANNLIPAWQGVSSKDYVALIPKEAKAAHEGYRDSMDELRKGEVDRGEYIRALKVKRNDPDDFVDDVAADDLAGDMVDDFAVIDAHGGRLIRYLPTKRSLKKAIKKTIRETRFKQKGKRISERTALRYWCQHAEFVKKLASREDTSVGE